MQLPEAKAMSEWLALNIKFSRYIQLKAIVYSKNIVDGKPS